MLVSYVLLYTTFMSSLFFVRSSCSVNMLHPPTQSITSPMQVVGVKVDNMAFGHFFVLPEVSDHQTFSIQIIEEICLTRCVDIHHLAFLLLIHIHNQVVWSEFLQSSITFLRNHLIKRGEPTSRMKITLHHPGIR